MESHQSSPSAAAAYKVLPDWVDLRSMILGNLRMSCSIDWSVDIRFEVRHKVLNIGTQIVQCCSKHRQNLWSGFAICLYRPSLSFIVDNMMPKTKTWNKLSSGFMMMFFCIMSLQLTHRKSMRSDISDALAGAADAWEFLPNTSTITLNRADSVWPTITIIQSTIHQKHKHR